MRNKSRFCLFVLISFWEATRTTTCTAFQQRALSSWRRHLLTISVKRESPFPVVLVRRDSNDESVPTSDLSTNRRLFLTSVLITAGGVALGADAFAANGATTIPNQPQATKEASLPWETNPVNKRSGVTVFDAEEAGYNVGFVTYLSRFLLNFDAGCQRYWFLAAVPSSAKADEVEAFRLNQFARFSASVEVGLQGYTGKGGSLRLLQDLVQRYGTLPGKVPSDSDSTVMSRRRIARSARRHIALLFGLLEKNQPTREITKLLASVDNGSVKAVQMGNESIGGYQMAEEPLVEFPAPQAGDGYQTAEGRAVLKPTGRILRLDIANQGSGYATPPAITISPPKNGGNPAVVKAKIATSGPNKGSLVRIKLLDTGTGYSDQEDVRIEVGHPDDGQVAVVTPVFDLAVGSIEITKEGSGYAVEKPLKVTIAPPLSADESGKLGETRIVGLAYPSAEKSSFTSFRREGDTKQLFQLEEEFETQYNLKPISGALSGLDGGVPPLPFWSGKSSSAELLRLLPAGVGLQYDTTLKRYGLSVNTDFMEKYPAVLQQGSTRIIGTEFGPRGRSPIERDMELGLSAYSRFCLSGAVCAAGVHGILLPIDVSKTKQQTNPAKYPNITSTFKTIANEESVTTFFAGWLPTLLGNFVGGGILYVVTEYIRRSLSEMAGVDAVSLEVPIILAAAGAILNCPFEAVRIRTVAQPDYAPNSVEVLKRMLNEEGVDSLVNAIPIFLVKNIPYAMTKFTVFDLSTERMYEAFPAAQEDIRLSLIVSLIGGILGGTAAALVSNPADTVISELKKAKSDISPQQAVSNMLERSGVSTFFVGLPLRMVFYSLVASLTFVSYDYVRFLLKIGPDDLKLYLDVLGGALGKGGASLA